MFTLFSRIILSNWRSLIVLFVVILFSSTGFITLRQITTNINALVASETRPLFGADLMVSPRGYASGDVLPLVAPYLSGTDYRVAERREFSTTLLDRDGKAGLVQVIAYSGSYPQRGVLKVEAVNSEQGTMNNGGKIKKIEDSESGSEGQKQAENPPSNSPFSRGGFSDQDRVAVTPGLLEKFSSGGAILLDGRKLRVTEKILESTDLGFSLGTENHLIVLPSQLLSGSLLLSSGSRLDHDLLISFSDERRAIAIAKEIKENLSEDLYRVRTYEDRTERNLDTVETLTDYITLILLISSIFAFIILRSAHESFYESLSRTLRVTEILGLARSRQQKLLLMLYGVIVPTGFLIATGVSYGLIELLQMIPEASEFQFFASGVPYALVLLIMIVIMAWWPAWWRMGDGDEKTQSKKIGRLWFLFLSSPTGSGIQEVGKKRQDSEMHPEGQGKTEQILPSSEGQKPQEIQEKLKHWILSFFSTIKQNLARPDILIPFILGIIILILLFESPLFALSVGVGTAVFFLVFGSLLTLLYRFIFSRVGFLRERRFYLFDAIRTLVRPLMPTLPITISLISVTVFFLVFASFSLAFRSKLVIDSTNIANVYAINILESDRAKVEKVIGSGALMYDILRARILGVNGQTLSEYLGEERPSGEFTREFNITTTKLENKILRGKEKIGKGEISMDDAFARRLGVDVGDTVSFLLSGREISLSIANIRESVREGFRPFFYFSFDPVEFARAPRTYFIAEYTSDTEAWKGKILTASGPHVTFIDIESILAIVRDISAKVLSVIGLFFATVLVFALGAIVAFFARVRPLESMKSRLYTLFGASPQDIRTTLQGSRGMIFGISYILSVFIGAILSYSVLSVGGFFSFSLPDFLMIAGVTGIAYIVLFFLLRPKK